MKLKQENTEQLKPDWNKETKLSCARGRRVSKLTQHESCITAVNSLPTFLHNQKTHFCWGNLGYFISCITPALLTTFKRTSLSLSNFLCLRKKNSWPSKRLKRSWTITLHKHISFHVFGFAVVLDQVKLISLDRSLSLYPSSSTYVSHKPSNKMHF